MKIENVESFLIRIPFHTGGRKTWASFGSTLDYVFLRIDTDAGISGWGDAFAYGAATATKAAVDNMIGPALIGQDARDIAGISYRLQQANHIWGRYGITIFAISGVDIALWDIAGKTAGLPVHQLLGGRSCETLPAYASLPKYQDPETVAERTAHAVGQGYAHVKLHETEVAETAAAREAAGGQVGIMLDTNCPWSPRKAREMAEQLAEYDLFWLEEPIFPPEDFAALAELQMESGIPIAAGENACTSFEFQKMFEAEAVKYAQPSVTKVGGITEFRKVATLAEAANVTLVPHSPYFGPGFLASLHLLVAMPDPFLIEHIYLDLEAYPFGDLNKPDGNAFRVPDGPGLGADPDPEVLKDYRVAD
ncbi:MAG: mandelate racemase/muconate lactonizing enzyme family protein [Alphaproteobacteria bacterium]|nr:mandelate racemase/muconate lactonizing enzyme family protein [Alphaproteobacteria bacterium]